MTDRVSHGVPPLGYKTVPHPSGKGKALARDSEGYKLLHEIKTKLVDENQSLTSIVRWLNAEGKFSNVSKARGGGKKWSVSTLKRTLTSQRTQGFRVMSVFDPAPTEAAPDRKNGLGRSWSSTPRVSRYGWLSRHSPKRTGVGYRQPSVLGVLAARRVR